jgi:hypothetical protein
LYPVRVKVGTNWVKVGTNWVKVGTNWVKVGTNWVKVGTNWVKVANSLTLFATVAFGTDSKLNLVGCLV